MARSYPLDRTARALEITLKTLLFVMSLDGHLTESTQVWTIEGSTLTVEPPARAAHRSGFTKRSKRAAKRAAPKGQLFTNAKSSGFTTSACVVHMPCGNP